jgi:hypothetical protein
MKLHSEARRNVGMHSALIVSNSGIIRVQGKTQMYYNYGEVGHLSKVCPKSLKKRDRWT